MVILCSGEFGEGIEPGVVVTDGGAGNGLITTAEIMAVLLGVAVRMNTI